MSKIPSNLSEYSRNESDDYRRLMSGFTMIDMPQSGLPY